jgi:hypothetical protein
MSIKSKVLATAASLALVGGVGTAGVLGTAATANAATPSCGFNCVDIFSHEFGTHGDPHFFLDVWRQHIRIGQPIILFRASNNDIAEDFRLEFQGDVSDFFAAGMVSSAFALHFGCIAGVTFPTCLFPATNDPAFEIEYAPLGQLSGLCVGVASTAVQEEGVTLQQCGASSKTVWAIDLTDQPFVSVPVPPFIGRLFAPDERPFFAGFAPLINGSDTNFSHPFVLTYPQSGFPTDRPRPQLQVDNLSGFTNANGLLNFPSINDNQLWGANIGPFQPQP